MDDVQRRRRASVMCAGCHRLYRHVIDIVSAGTVVATVEGCPSCRTGIYTQRSPAEQGPLAEQRRRPRCPGCETPTDLYLRTSRVAFCLQPDCCVVDWNPGQNLLAVWERIARERDPDDDDD